LAREGNAYRLAVSVHAPDDSLRNRLVPVNRNVGLAAIIEAVDDYFRVSGRRVTFEYILLDGINDQPHHARLLAEIVKGRPSLVNVIPYNRVEGLPYETPSPLAVRRFVKALRDRGVVVQQRKRKGDRIDAACGQLRRSFEEAAT
jgi:23S rRNA (adenine2503-C2)-methyltransferase